MNYIDYLLKNDLACMVRDETKIIKEAKGRGIAPLYQIYKDGADYSGCFLTDKITGIGAAHLCALMRFKEVETAVISKKAYEILNRAGIKSVYNIMADNILNHQKNDLCPLEKKFVNYTGQMTPVMIIEEFLDSIR